MRRFFSVLDRSMEIVIIAIFVVMVIAGGMQVFNRFVLNRSLSWSEELQRYAHIWMVYLAIPVAYRRGARIGMEVLKERFSATVQKALSLLTHALWIGLALAIIVFGQRIMQVASRQTSPGMGIPMNVPYLGLVVGSVYLLIIALRKLVDEFRPTEE